MTPRFDPFEGPGPRWFTIPAHRPFLEDLAAGVLDWLGEGAPEALPDLVLLLPNRRAARAFTGALAQASGGRAVLLPEVRPLGDLQEDEPPFAPGELGLDLPPAIDPLARRFEMARMIVEEFDPGLAPLRALDMADALGAFLDSCQIEEIDDLARVADLAEHDLAEHWREAARFLGLAVEAWPRRLEALGRVDPAWRRAALMRRLAETWDAAPPQRPVIAAGSTGAAPAAAAVLAAVAAAPRGAVVLPGLDLGLEAPVWALADEQHPQGGLKRLLDRLGVDRAWVRPWPGPAADRRAAARGRVLAEALRPAEATGDWRGAIQALRREAAGAGQARDPVAEGLEGLSVLAVRAEEEAAAAIALMMRGVLETPGATCALVTPDLDLTRRVEARLGRWGIVADSSAGAPLARLEAGVLVDLAARWLAGPTDPHALLGLLKHPRLRLDAATPRAVAALERSALRGPRPRDWAALNRRLRQAAGPDDRGRAPPEGVVRSLDDALALAARLEAALAPARAVFADGRAPLDEGAAALAGLVEALAGQGAWVQADGEAAAALMAGLIEGGGALGQVSAAELRDLAGALLAEATVRAGGATHPSLRILGTQEGRLARADLMILAGLEDGVWPGPAPTDPFLSRPMRAALGLPPPERRIGEAAQDFVQAASSPRAVLVHRERRGGQLAVRSRWLWRLAMLARGADTDRTPIALAPPPDVLDWTRALDAPPPGRPRLSAPPAPRPPVARRPRALYVTRVERWVRDPYALYARMILGLEEMERPGASAEALARGDAVHKAMERLTLAWPHALPDDLEEGLARLLLEALVEHGFDEAAMAREAPLARNGAAWLAGFERRRRARGVAVLAEQQGALTFDAPAGPFTLKAYADRIELSATGGAVLDFKTGLVPSGKQVRAGFAPQLTLSAAILAGGGFAATNGPVTPEDLTYVRLTGRRPPGQAITHAVGAEAAALAEAALEGLRRRVARFDDPATPYVSWAAPQFMGGHGGYDHLARVWEWRVVGADGDGGDESGGAE